MKKKHPEHVNLERWLVSYADFITLLFAFFVVMYALSLQDLAKVKAAAQSIRQAFGGPVSTAAPGALGAPGGPGDSSRDFPGDSHDSVFDPHGASAQSFRNLQTALEEVAGLESGSADLGDRMQTLVDSRGLVVRFSAQDFFGRGEAVVKPDLRPLLDRIGRVIARTHRMVRIEGHSDAFEAKSPGNFSSDWELSAARAAWVAKYWITRFAMDPRRLSVAGHAHYQPLESGEPSGSKGASDEWSRGKNRRIEIIILNDTLKESP